MIQISVKQASNELEKLLRKVARGQELVIIGSDGTAFKLLVLPRIPQPIFGSAHGLVHIGSDFDEPIEGFEEHTGHLPGSFGASWKVMGEHEFITQESVEAVSGASHEPQKAITVQM